MYSKRNFTYLVQILFIVAYTCVYLCNFNEYFFKFTYYYYYADFYFFEHLRSRTRGKVQRKRTMRVRRTRLKWDEVQDTVCPSRWNFAHVPLSRSLQPGKGRMAGKSRTVEVRFYKESRVLGCDGKGEQMPLEYLYFTMQMEKYSQVHLGRRGGEMVSFTLCTLSFLLPPFVLQRLFPFYSVFSFPLISFFAFFILFLRSSSLLCV